MTINKDKLQEQVKASVIRLDAVKSKYNSFLEKPYDFNGWMKRVKMHIIYSDALLDVIRVIIENDPLGNFSEHYDYYVDRFSGEVEVAAMWLSRLVSPRVALSPVDNTISADILFKYNHAFNGELILVGTESVEEGMLCETPAILKMEGLELDSPNDDMKPLLKYHADYMYAISVMIQERHIDIEKVNLINMIAMKIFHDSMPDYFVGSLPLSSQYLVVEIKRLATYIALIQLDGEAEAVDRVIRGHEVIIITTRILMAALVKCGEKKIKECEEYLNSPERLIPTPEEKKIMECSETLNKPVPFDTRDCADYDGETGMFPNA